MRLWSIHPKYLDTKGLVAVWRESLLARKVLEGKTKGYKHHPQLNRFIDSNNALETINQYLYEIYKESVIRKYNFDKTRIYISKDKIDRICVNSEQINYEFELLKSKLIKRDYKKYLELNSIDDIELNPIFYEIIGKIEKWEKIIPELIDKVKK
jgi:hypothetical protein